MANNPGNNAKPIELLQAALQGDYEVHALDVHDYPLFLAFAAPQAESETGRKPRLPSGRGLTKADALTGAAAEAMELRASLAHKIPKGLHEFTKIDGYDQIRVRSLVDQSSIMVPAQQVFLDYAAFTGEKLQQDADSTGCATATTLAASFQRGLLECIERDAVASWWYGRQSRPHLPLTLLDAIAPRISWWLSRRARTAMLIDLTSDVGVPCVGAVSADGNGLNVAIGTAAALSTADAALSAVLEMLQTEVTMEFGRAGSNEELASWRRSASTKTMPQFVALTTPASPFGIQALQLHKAVTDTGHIPYGIELTLPDDPLITTRVLIPGFSALNRKINVERIASACGLRSNGNYRFEMLEPF